MLDRLQDFKAKDANRLWKNDQKPVTDQLRIRKRNDSLTKQALK